MNVRVKICGITDARDAHDAVEAGADALGFMFFKDSPRCLTVPVAAQIIRNLPPFVAKVGVFVNPTAEEVHQAIESCRLDTLQFHGDETRGFCRGFGLRVIKAFRVRDADSLRPMPVYDQEAWLLDAHVEGKLGGTGQRFNWELAADAVRLGRPVILAGGLTPHNVAEAVRWVKPYAVDVSSGVESDPGRKDADKVRAFIEAARGAGAS